MPPSSATPPVSIKSFSPPTIAPTGRLTHPPPDFDAPLTPSPSSRNPSTQTRNPRLKTASPERHPSLRNPKDLPCSRPRRSQPSIGSSACRRTNPSPAVTAHTSPTNPTAPAKKRVVDYIPDEPTGSPARPARAPIREPAEPESPCAAPPQQPSAPPPRRGASTLQEETQEADPRRTPSTRAHCAEKQAAN